MCLRSVSCGQIRPKTLEDEEHAQRRLSSSTRLVNYFSGSCPVPSDKSSETAPKISCAPLGRGGNRPLREPAVLCAQGNEMQNEKHHAQPRLSNHYDKVHAGKMIYAARFRTTAVHLADI